MPTDENKEIEVKFAVKDFSSYREALQASGGKHTKTVFEKNFLFDDDARSLTRAGKLLRLRDEGEKIKITFKQRLPNPDFKECLEYKVEVTDFTEAKTLVEALGFQKVFAYEKKREGWHLGEAYVTFDEVPCGKYIEIEADAQIIRELACKMGLDMRNALTHTYADLWREYCKAKGLGERDMVFE